MNERHGSSNGAEVMMARSPKTIRRAVFVICVSVALAVASLRAEDSGMAPSPKDKCPVCGMFVHKYPEFLASILLIDGSRVFFDGPKDLYRYYFNVQKYDQKHRQADIVSIRVKDYYSLAAIDGRKALYVVGSDVYGPMGNELIPFEKESEAREFMQDHKGSAVLRFGDITQALLKGLER